MGLSPQIPILHPLIPALQHKTDVEPSITNGRHSMGGAFPLRTPYHVIKKEKDQKTCDGVM